MVSHPSRCFFCKVGLLHYLRPGEKETITINPDKYVSEACLWLAKWTHKGKLTAVAESMLFTIDAESFVNVVSQFELALYSPIMYAKEFLQKTIEADEDGSLTDLPAEMIRKDMQHVSAKLSRGRDRVSTFIARVTSTRSAAPRQIDCNRVNSEVSCIDCFQSFH